MTTIAEARPVVTGGVDTHLDMHLAAVVTVVGGVLGTAELSTTAPTMVAQWPAPASR